MVAERGILTKGLGVDLPACCGMITAQFNLTGCGCTIIVTPVEKPGGGGPYPYVGAHNQVANIQDFYKPVDPNLLVRRQDEIRFNKTSHVVIKVTLGEKTIEREYIVPEKRGKKIVKIVNIINNTQKRVKVVIHGLKRVTTAGIVKIKNIFKRR